METLLQFGGRIKFSLEPSRTFAGTIRYQRKRPALLRQHPLTAESSRTFAGTIRWQRIAAALLQEGFETTFGEKSCGLCSAFNF